MFMQFHGGVYRSDDAGASWTAIGDGLPSDFGFPMVLDPADPDSAYVIPLAADTDRVTPGGHVRVYETRDAGATWTARGDGLPSQDAYLTVLLQALDKAGAGDALEDIDEIGPGSATGRMNARSSEVDAPASTELTMPANSTARPDVSIEISVASRTSRPAPRSSLKRLRISSA